MRQPKMLLAWGTTTVIGQVISTYAAAGVDEIVIVTGGAREEVERESLRVAQRIPVRCIHNQNHDSGEMLSSLQTGLNGLGTHVEAALIGLGDQPQLSMNAVQKVISTYQETTSPLIVPSFNMHRGHPWLVDRCLWFRLMDLQPPQILRNFLHECASFIFYVEADQTILKDLDTPEEYQREKP